MLILGGSTIGGDAETGGLTITGTSASTPGGVNIGVLVNGSSLDAGLAALVIKGIGGGGVGYDAGVSFVSAATATAAGRSR